MSNHPVREFPLEKARGGLAKLSLNFAKIFSDDGNLLANVSNISGMGKTFFLTKVAALWLNASGVSNKVLSVSNLDTAQDAILDLTKQITEYFYSDILIETPENSNKKKLVINLENLEQIYSVLYQDISLRKSESAFALLIDDFDRIIVEPSQALTIMKFIEKLSEQPGSVIILTSYNDLIWHSWEMRNRCRYESLAPFDYEELQDICFSESLTKLVLKFSDGHPRTTLALLKSAIREVGSDVHVFNSDDLENRLKDIFLDELKMEIDKDLLHVNDEWMREFFWLIAPADNFDTDLIIDIVKEFGIEIPDQVTDIAWEMSNTGFASWDFDDKAYKINPQLRNRILVYEKDKRKDDLARIYITLAKAYRLRAEILIDWDVQVINYIYYLSKSKSISEQSKDILGEIESSLEPWLLNAELREELIKKIELSEQLKQQHILEELSKWLSSSIGDTVASQTERGVDMNLSNAEKLSKIYIDRPVEEYEFNSLLKGEIESEKWILNIVGGAGLGKSRLIGRFYELAHKERRQVAYIDLHYRKNRQRGVFIQTLVAQLQIDDPVVTDAMQKLISFGQKKEMDYTGIAPKESFDEASRNLTIALSNAINATRERNKQRYIILIDTFDNDPSISYLSSWLFNELIVNLERSIYLVIAGRRSLDTVWNIPPTIATGIKLLQLGVLDTNAIHKIAESFDPENKSFTGELGDRIAFLSQGNPLIADWLLYYSQRFPAYQELDKWEPNTVADRLAQYTLDEKHYIAKVMRVAAHFGSHFNLEIFKIVIPTAEQLGGRSHEDVFHELARYFYSRSTIENWTLHDEIRQRILDALKQRLGVSQKELVEFSEKVIQSYYAPKVAELKARQSALTPDELAEFDDLIAEWYYHALFVNVKDNYLKIWDYLDFYWHSYRLEQMAQIIQFSREIQKRRREAETDIVLTNILDAAEAWMNYSDGNISEAIESANKVIESGSSSYRPPRRLQATAEVVLGLSTRDPLKSINSYLKPALHTYQGLRSQLESLEDYEEKNLPGNEFCDSLIDVYQELHMVLLNIGRIHWQHFFDLDEGEAVLHDAYALAMKENWNKPLYQATALNEWARIRRFRGDFNDAFDKITKAITIFQQHGQSGINLGLFYETLGMVYKATEDYDNAKKAFEKSLKIFDGILGPVEKYKSSVQLELGHILFLQRDWSQARENYTEAYNILKNLKDSRLYYYLNALNKLGELDFATYKKDNDRDYLLSAKKYFEEQKDVASEEGYDLWEYWATQFIAEIDFEENWPEHKNELQETLENLLAKFDKKLHREFGPAFWATKYLLFVMSTKEQNKTVALMHLADGLGYLAKNWSVLFSRQLRTLRCELLDLDPVERAREAENLIKIWKIKFGENDPAKEFIQMCRSFMI